MTETKRRRTTEVNIFPAADGGGAVVSPSCVVPSGDEEVLEEELDELDEEEDEEEGVLVGVPGVVVMHSSGHSSSPGGSHSG